MHKEKKKQTEKLTKEVKGLNFKGTVYMIIKGETHCICVINEKIAEKEN